MKSSCGSPEQHLGVSRRPILVTLLPGPEAPSPPALSFGHLLQACHVTPQCVPTSTGPYSFLSSQA